MPFDKEHGKAPANAAPPKLELVDGRVQAADERACAGTADETLVAQVLAGRRWAQREVWYRFAPMVFGLFRRSLSARHDHEDLVQEVFIRVFRRLHTLHNATAIRSFVYSIALRVMSEEIRHFQVVQRARTQLVLAAVHSSGGADFEARDTLARIQQILDGMKDKHRAVFVLRHVEGMELLEIADGLGISLATVKRYLVKAMRTIERAASADEELVARLGFAPCRTPLGGNA
ncbi:MAG: sigma-70 family RNA polymerase sigma factor [Deltaproteobacteria bacterium]|nr:sigma-70 family RNA polymerase sigma factor [Deltaproteobacteria bacterium]